MSATPESLPRRRSRGSQPCCLRMPSRLRAGRALRGLVLFVFTCVGFSACGGKAHVDTTTTTQSDAPDSLPEVRLSLEAVKRAGIAVGRAGPTTISIQVDLPGEVKLDSERVLILHPRFAGVVRQMRKSLGDLVNTGEVVALVQSNESLTDYAITSTMSGRVMERGATPGQAVTPDVPLYTVANLSQVWVEFAVYPHQIGSIRRGESVRVTRTGTGLTAIGTISYVSSVLAEDTRVSLARVVLPNLGGRWEPGLFVNVSVTTDRATVPVGVPDDAVVRVGEGSAVFVARGSTFVRRPVVIGRNDGRMAEVLSGLATGDSVVVHNAFVLKSELEKSRAEE